MRQLEEGIVSSRWVGPEDRCLYEAIEGLDPPRTRALQAIILGKSVQEAADAAGVDRSTLFRWRTCDPLFMAALTSWRRDVAGSVYDRLANLEGSATAAVQFAIEAGDGRLAFRVLSALKATQSVEAIEQKKPAIAYKRWMLRINNPGAKPEEVEAFLMTQFDLSARDAGNATYRSHTIRRPLERPVADSLARRLRDLGAYVVLGWVDVVVMPENLPDGYAPGPIELKPENSGPPGYFRLPLDDPDAEALDVRLRKRIAELEAMDKKDEDQKKEKASRVGVENSVDKIIPSAEKTP